MSGGGKASKGLTAFKVALQEAGAEILGPTNPYEMLRFRTSKGVGVIYSGRRGETWNAEAIEAREHLAAKKGSLAPVQVKGRRKDKATVTSLLERDGDACFFCGASLGGDITVEHLVAIAHGGPNHISNLFLAHAACNQQAGHKSAPEKIAIALHQRLSAPDAFPGDPVSPAPAVPPAAAATPAGVNAAGLCRSAAGSGEA